MADDLGRLLETGWEHEGDSYGAAAHKIGMFTRKPIPGKVEGTGKEIPRALEDRAYDYLPSWVRTAAKTSFAAVPPEGWILASFLGPKAAGRLAAKGDTRPQQALDKAREINARMVAEGKSLEEINVAIHEATAKILGEGRERPVWRSKNPATGRMRKEKLGHEPSPYGGAFRVPSHLDNPPPKPWDEPLTPKQVAEREAYRQNPDFAFEVSDAGPRGLQINYDKLGNKRWWWPFGGTKSGTQRGVEGPYFTHDRLAEAYPELKDWTFTIETGKDGLPLRKPGGATDPDKKTVHAAGDAPGQRGYTGSRSRADRIKAGMDHDPNLPSMLVHEGTHVNLGGIEGMPHQGSNPLQVMLTDKWRGLWGGRRRRDAFDDFMGLDTGAYAAGRAYEKSAGEWLPRKGEERHWYTGEELRKHPILDPKDIGFSDLPAGRQPAFPKKKRGESGEAYLERYNQHMSEQSAKRRDRERYPGEEGWTEPPTSSELVRNYYIPKYAKRVGLLGGLAGAGYGVKKLADWVDGEPAGEDVETPKALADTPLGAKILKERGQARFDKIGNAVSLVGNAVATPMALKVYPGLGKAMAGVHAYWAHGSYRDMKAAADRRQTWEALRRGYLNKLDKLDRESVPDEPSLVEVDNERLAELLKSMPPPRRDNDPRSGSW